MTDADYPDYADNLALLANTTAQAEFLLHSLEWVAGGISLYVNQVHVLNKKELSPFSVAGLKNKSTSSRTSAEISHLLKEMSTYTWKELGLLLTAYRSYGNLISYRINRNFFQVLA